MTNLAPPDLAEPQPALAPLWPDVARALAAVAAGCTVGILIRIGLWDTGYFPNSYFRLSHVPLALPPIMCVILGALAMRSLFPPEHPPPASVAFGAATLLIAGASVAIGIFARQNGFPSETPPWLVEATRTHRSTR